MSSDTVVEAVAGRVTRRDAGEGRGVRGGVRAMLLVARDPVEGVERVREKLADVRQRRAGPTSLEADPAWASSLHSLLHVPWPCDEIEAFGPLWSETLGSLGRRGLEVGRGAYGGWDDADPGFARAVWCVTRHLEPQTVVETGVARGFTTRVILEALHRNGTGQLCSIDLPPPLERRRLEDEAGAAVPGRLKGRWTLVEGSSRRRLPKLLEELSTIDLFVHDSRHTNRNVSFELTLAWSALNPDGFQLADDVHCNTAFAQCVSNFGGPPAIVCASDDGRGMFGLIQKRGATEAVRSASTSAAPRALPR
jgi:hypothetical protein